MVAVHTSTPVPYALDEPDTYTLLDFVLDFDQDMYIKYRKHEPEDGYYDPINGNFYYKQETFRFDGGPPSSLVADEKQRWTSVEDRRRYGKAWDTAHRHKEKLAERVEGTSNDRIKLHLLLANSEGKVLTASILDKIAETTHFTFAEETRRCPPPLFGKSEKTGLYGWAVLSDTGPQFRRPAVDQAGVGSSISHREQEEIHGRSHPSPHSHLVRAASIVQGLTPTRTTHQQDSSAAVNYTAYWGAFHACMTLALEAEADPKWTMQEFFTTEPQHVAGRLKRKMTTHWRTLSRSRGKAFGLDVTVHLD